MKIIVYLICLLLSILIILFSYKIELVSSIVWWIGIISTTNTIATIFMAVIFSINEWWEDKHGKKNQSKSRL